MKFFRALFLAIIFLSACAPSPEEQATQMATALTATADAWTETASPTATAIPSETSAPTATQTLTPTVTLTPSITPSPTISPTPTFSFPTVRVNKQAHCRYGPSVAYLHAADLYPDDTGTVRGRYIYSNWLYVRFDKLNYSCWVAPSVVDVVGDITKVNYTQLNLQSIGSNMYGPPENVTAVR